MPVIAPTAATPRGAAPSTASPTNFDTRADALLGALPTMVTELNALGTNVYANAGDAASSAVTSAAQAAAAATAATNASISAANAATSSGAAMWVTGTTYALGAATWSPANRVIYRKITASSVSNTDPSTDPTNWALLGTVGMSVVVVSTTTQVAAVNGHYVLTNVALTTVTLPATPASGATVAITPANGLLTNVIARNGSTIMGLSEDMTLDSASVTVTLRFLNNDWRMI
jgi:hypothetical protein